MRVKIQRLNSEAVLPSYYYGTDAGMDLHSSETLSLKPGQRVLVSTRIRMEIPKGFVGLIWDKSGLAAKKGLKTMAGVVDSGYRGEVKVCLFNTTSEDFVVEKGMQVAQMLIQKVENPEIVEVEELDASERGDGGWGSTGLYKRE